MKKTLSLIITVCMILASLVILPVSAADVEYKPDTSWYNATDTEFTISTPWELLGVSEVMKTANETFEGKTIKLANNIILNTENAEEWKTKNATNAWTPIGNSATRFKGTFDGQGNAVSGIFVYAFQNGSGMFGIVDGATIKNLSIVNSYFYTAGNALGALVGSVAGTGATISDIYVDAIIETILETTGVNVAGIAGEVKNDKDGKTTISNCVFAGDVNARAYVGGIVGETWYSSGTLEISNCANFGSVTGVAHSVAGMVGRAKNVTVKNCLNAGNVLSTTGSYASGLIGRIQGGTISLIDSYSCTDAIPSTQATAPVNNYYGVIKDEDTTTVTSEGCGETTTSAIKGADAASVLTALDFENTWTTVDNQLPTLKCAVTLITNAAVVPTYPEYVAPGDNGDDSQDTSNNNGSTSGDQTTTDNKTTDTAKDTSSDAETEIGGEKGGCGSSVALGSFAILAVSAAGVAFVGKKKKNQE